MPTLNPRTSILVPCFNGASYLRDCLESILAQSCTDFELLVVDDASTDQTATIAEEYARKDKRVRVINNRTNLGLVNNWNRSVRFARGQWIKFVFQDDIIAPTCLHQLLAMGEATGCPLVFGRRNFIFEKGVTAATAEEYRRGAVLIEERFPASGLTDPKTFSELALEHPTENFIGEPVAVLFRKDIVTKIGLFNPHLIVFCDMEYWMRIGVNAGVAHVAENLASFRVHSRSTTAESVRNREFRMYTLDHVIVSHEFAFHPAYKPLRAAAGKLGIDLQRRYKEKVVWANGVATQQGIGEPEPNRSSLREFREVQRAYPKITQTLSRHRRAYYVRRLLGSARDQVLGK